VPSPSSGSAALATLLLLACCARPAPPLPQAAAPSGEPADCRALDVRLARIATDMDDLEARITANRGSNQALSYFSAVLFPPLLLATEGNHAEKQALDDRQRERDALLAERAHGGCAVRSVEPATGRMKSGG